MEQHWWWPFSKPTQEPEQVRCADCGFLCVLSQKEWTYIEADLFYRKEGFYGGEPNKVFVEPHCSIHFQSIHSEPLKADGGSVQLTDPGGGILSLKNKEGKDIAEKAVLANITKLRFCDGFFL